MHANSDDRLRAILGSVVRPSMRVLSGGGPAIEDEVGADVECGFG